MAHATAPVLDDATTRAVSPHGTPVCTHCGFVCSCQRLVDAGWSVRCNACGRGTTAVAEATGAPAADLLTLVYRPGEHTCGLLNCEACMDELAVDEDLVDPDAAYDAGRDDRLVDDAERAA